MTLNIFTYINFIPRTIDFKIYGIIQHAYTHAHIYSTIYDYVIHRYHLSHIRNIVRTL